MILQILNRIIRRIKNSIYFFVSWEKIDNETLRTIIRFFEFFNLIPSIRSNKADTIVSLTTYGERFSEVHYTLFSLFKQKVKPDKIVLWLDEDEFTLEQVSNDKYLSKYIQKGLEVKFCKNYGSYKKFVPALNNYPDATIIICDDDAYYAKNWLNLLLNEHKQFPNELLCHAGTRTCIEKNKLLPYKKWTDVRNNSIGFDIIPVGVGGTLFNHSFFYKDICNDKLFMEIAPKTDDLWLWAQAVLNYTKIRVINNSLFRPIDLGSDRDYPKLWISNAVSGNDKNINNLIDFYPKLKEALNIK